MKKLLSRITFGFTLGITLLMITYLVLYHISGQETFYSLFSKLNNINTFQTQILIMGFCGTIISLAFYLVETQFSKENISTIMTVIIFSLFLLTCIISMFLIENIACFDKVVQDLLTVIGIIFFIVCGLIGCIETSINEFIINKKIKEKNS